MWADPSEVLSLEADANRAWPAREIVTAPNWELRWGDGLHRRTCSATVYGGADLDEALAATTAFYAERDAPAIIKLTREASPPRLEPLLADRGWVLQAPTQVRSRLIGEVEGEPSIDLDVPLEPWVAAFTEASGYDAEQTRTLTALLGRIGDPVARAAASVGDTIAAVGLGVRVGTRLGVFEMVTFPQHRGKGLAGAILRSLLAWGRDGGADEAFLQVLADNRTAIHLYARMGFMERYRYWYRVAQ